MKRISCFKLFIGQILKNKILIKMQNNNNCKKVTISCQQKKYKAVPIF